MDILMEGDPWNILGMPNIEYLTLMKLFQWMKDVRPAPEYPPGGTPYKFMGSLSMQVCPNNYFISFYDIAIAMRLLLKRLVFVNTLASRLKTNIKYVEGPQEDFFTCENLPMPCFAYTNKTCGLSAPASFDSWAYHIILNGPWHPFTRERIDKLVCGTHDETLACKSLHVNPVFQVPNLVMLYDSLRVPMQVPNEEPIDLEKLMKFELLFGIPVEKSFSTLLIENVFDDLEDSPLSLYEGQQVFRRNTYETQSIVSQDPGSDSDQSETTTEEDNEG